MVRLNHRDHQGCFFSPNNLLLPQRGSGGEQEGFLSQQTQYISVTGNTKKSARFMRVHNKPSRDTIKEWIIIHERFLFLPLCVSVLCPLLTIITSVIS